MTGLCVCLVFVYCCIYFALACLFLCLFMCVMSSVMFVCVYFCVLVFWGFLVFSLSCVLGLF